MKTTSLKESLLFSLPDLLQHRSAKFEGACLEGFIGHGLIGRVYNGVHARKVTPASPFRSLAGTVVPVYHGIGNLLKMAASVKFGISGIVAKIYGVPWPLIHSEVRAVHAGSWRGGTVAVKVLCHAGNRAAKLNALHESVVCAHVQHPNVV